MGRLRDIVIGGDYAPEPGGGLRVRARLPRPLHRRPDQPAEVLAQDEGGGGLRQRHGGRLRARTPEKLGVEVVPLDCELDWTFPRYNANPEDLHMLHAMAEAVKESGADVALGFDGDGDRCGVVDNEGAEIFADKIGVMLARDLSKLHRGATFVVDVKSTGLFATDPALKANGVKVDFWKTGHSHIKRRVAISRRWPASKSGHFFFNAPVGRGYDDGFVTAIAVLEMLDRNPTKSMADLYRDLPKTWGSPTMSPHAPTRRNTPSPTRSRRGSRPCGRRASRDRPKFRDIVTVNGVRVTVEDGTWGLVRASSNKPELVVVVESPASEAQHARHVQGGRRRAARKSEVGAYNQTIPRTVAGPGARARSSIQEGAHATWSRGRSLIVSSADPICSMRPAFRMATRSASSSASSWSWVTNTVVSPVRSCNSRSQLRRSLRTLASSAPNGSSSSSTRGSIASARANATRWRWPPDSCADSARRGPAAAQLEQIRRRAPRSPPRGGPYAAHCQAEGNVLETDMGRNRA